MGLAELRNAANEQIRRAAAAFVAGEYLGPSGITQAQVDEQPPGFFGGIPSYLWSTVYPKDRREPYYPSAPQKVATVYAIITRLSNDVASLPIKVTLPGAKGRRKPLPDSHWLVQLFEEGNSAYSGYEVRRDLCAGLDTTGNSLLWFERYDKASTPEGIWHIPAHLTLPIMGPKRSIREYFYQVDAKTYPAEDVVPFRYWNPDWNPQLPSPWGLSPLSAARLAWEGRNLQGEALKKFFERGAQVAGLYTYDPNATAGFTSEQVEALQEEMLKIGGGVENINKPVIAPGIKQVRPPILPKDLQFLEMVLQNDTDIVRVYHVPPVIMGIKEGGGLSDAGAKTDRFLYIALPVQERADLIGKTLTKWCRKWVPGVEVELDTAGHILMADFEVEQAKSLSQLSGRAIYTLNEARERIGDDPADDPHADEYLVEFKSILSADIGADIRVNPSAVPTEAPKQDQPPPGAEPAKGKGGGGGGQSNQKLKLARKARWARRERDLRRYERRVNTWATVRFDAQEKAVVDRMRHVRFGQWLNDAAVARRLNDAAVARRFGDKIQLVSGEELLPHSLDYEDVQALFDSIMVDRGESAAAEVGSEIATDEFRRAVAGAIHNHSASMVTQIDSTTRADLVEAISAGVERGDDYNDLVAAVREVFDGRRDNAETIARTETAWAYNLAANKAWQDAGVQFKSWLTAEDEAVRESHTLCEDEGNIGIDEAFSNGLMYPGDPDGEAGEVINCRCILEPQTSEDSDLGSGDLGGQEVEEDVEASRKPGGFAALFSK